MSVAWTILNHFRMTPLGTIRVVRSNNFFCAHLLIYLLFIYYLQCSPASRTRTFTAAAIPAAFARRHLLEHPPMRMQQQGIKRREGGARSGARLEAIEEKGSMEADLWLCWVIDRSAAVVRHQTRVRMLLPS